MTRQSVLANAGHTEFPMILPAGRSEGMAPKLLMCRLRSAGLAMTQLGRRKHSRFLLSQPVEGNLRVREEVAIEEWNESELVILSPEPCRTDERLTLEIPGSVRHRVSVRVRESRPAVVADGPIRHRLRVSVEGHGPDVKKPEGREL